MVKALSLEEISKEIQEVRIESIKHKFDQEFKDVWLKRRTRETNIIIRSEIIKKSIFGDG